MRVLIITQDDKLYLPSTLAYLFTIMPKSIDVVGVTILEVSPFGKRYSIIQKAKQTLDVFGFYFFVRYSYRYLVASLKKRDSIEEICKISKIPVLKGIQNVNQEESLEKFRELNPDLIVSIAANQVFKKPLIDLAPKGCINLHSALLPRNRGLMPTFWALKHGDQETGVSVFFVDEGIDSGPILVQKTIKIGERCLDSLIERTKTLGMEAVVEAMTAVEHGNISLIDNDTEKSTYNKFPTRQDVIEFLQGGNRFF